MSRNGADFSFVSNAFAPLALFCALIFSACSTNTSYAPQNIESYIGYNGRISSFPVESNSAGLTLFSGKAIAKNTISTYNLLPKQKLIGYGEDKLITTDDNGTIRLLDKNGKEIFYIDTGSEILSASYKNNQLAFMTKNGDAFLASTKQSKILFVNKEKRPLTTTAKIAPPLFVDDSVIFGFLTGKVITVSLQTYKITNEKQLASDPYFNNIIHLFKLKNTVVAITPYKIYSLSKDSVKDYEVRSAISDGTNIIAFTLDGTGLLLDEDLEILSKEKFKFARIVGTHIINKTLFAVEKQGYLLKMKLNFDSAKIYSLPDNMEDYLLFSGNALYYGHKTINLDSL